MSSVMSVIRKIDDLLGHAAKMVTAIVLFVQLIIMCMGVIFRYALNSPLTWVDELACYLLVFTTFIGGYVALREGELAKIGFIVEKFSPQGRKILNLLANLTMLALAVGISYYGIKLGGMPTILKQRTPSMQIPMIVFYSFIPISGVLMLVNMLVKIYDGICENDGSAENEGGTGA